MTDEGGSCRYDSSIDSANQADFPVQRVPDTRSIGVSPIKTQVGNPREKCTEGPPCHYDSSSISVTDSATQADLSLLKAPDTRSIGVSPIKRPVSQTRENSTQTPAAVERKIHQRFHRRTHSEGDSLFYRKRAKDALRRVKKISRELQDSVPLPVRNTVDRGTESANPSGGNESAPEIKTQSIGCRCKTVEEALCTGKHSRLGASQKCALQQHVKTQQKTIRALRQQVGGIFINCEIPTKHIYC